MKRFISFILIILFMFPILALNVSAYLLEGICDICGAEAYLYGGKATTCTEDGYVEFSCHTVYYPALGHSLKEFYITPPTCTEQGVVEIRCANGCGLVVGEPTIVPPTGHNLVLGPPSMPICDLGDGEVSAIYCSNNCGLHSVPIIIPGNHIEKVDVAIAPTCTQTGLTEGSHCGVCNKVLVEQEVIPATHIESKYWLVTKEPTDTEVGERVKYCISCDEVLKTESFNSICKHTAVTDKSVSPTCSNIGLTEGSHCSKCNSVIVKQESIEKLSHTEVPTDEVAVTCTEHGFTGGTHCSVCNVTITKQEVLIARNHVLRYRKAVLPTCTEAGLSPEVYCSVCNEVIHEQFELPALGHGKAWAKEKPATCTETGLTKGSYCQVCNEVFEEQEVIPIIPHSYESEVSKEATCTEQGEKTYTCGCGDSYTETIPIDSNNHNHQSEVTKEATCLEEGTMTFTCSCGDSYTETIPLSKHTEVIDKAVPPTCEKTGLTTGKHCSVCNEVMIPQAEVPATGHNETISKAITPTCTKTGLTQGKFCSACKEVYIAQEVIPKLPHKLTNEIIAKETCTKGGERYIYCLDCDYEEYKTIYATGHNTKTIGRKSATYFAKGHTGKKICKDCNEVVSKGKVTAKKKLKTPKATIKGSKKKLTVKYKKVTDATGFQVKYKLGKKTIKKTYTTKKTKTITIKNLKKGTYKVYVRAFVKKASNKAYSSWTKVKKVRVM